MGNEWQAGLEFCNLGDGSWRRKMKNMRGGSCIYGTDSTRQDNSLDRENREESSISGTFLLIWLHSDASFPPMVVHIAPNSSRHPCYQLNQPGEKEPLCPNSSTQVPGPSMSQCLRC